MAAAVKAEKEEMNEETETKEVDTSKPKSSRDLIWECFQKVGGLQFTAEVLNRTRPL